MSIWTLVIDKMLVFKPTQYSQSICGSCWQTIVVLWGKPSFIAQGIYKLQYKRPCLAELVKDIRTKWGNWCQIGFGRAMIICNNHSTKEIINALQWQIWTQGWFMWLMSSNNFINLRPKSSCKLRRVMRKCQQWSNAFQRGWTYHSF